MIHHDEIRKSLLIVSHGRSSFACMIVARSSRHSDLYRVMFYYWFTVASNPLLHCTTESATLQRVGVFKEAYQIRYTLFSCES